MYNTCLRIVKDQQDAEDIMQEAFLSAFRNLRSYKKEVTFGAWLKRIVINRSIDHLKKKKIDLCPIDDKMFKLGEQPQQEQNRKSINTQVEQIKEAMKQLPDGYRIILSLYLLEGYDHQEIADILGISSSTSRSQYIRAKKRLRDILSKEGNM